ncbi:MAG: iron ABC transporter permease [Pseudomonadota bacterium]|nr:iron ABC transporter permease [Pseudomonadota bacterium]MDP1903093.1 iron ABC transporter permease [Pseudomonadota bacterium]MDP2353083.1 iron ABC transporter permease [Pseudomonadota bacterium]
MNRSRALLVIALLAVAALASLLLALAAGSVALAPGEVWAALLGEGKGGGEGMAVDVVRSLRLPRALSAFACGGLLALAGALMQVLLRNPLADPYVLGISGGAAVGALAAMLLGVSAGFGLEAAAFVGALAAMWLVFGLARGDGSWTQTRLLLTGVIVAAGCGAAVALMLSLAPDQQLRGMLFWLMGDASQAGNPIFVLLILLAGLLVAMFFARELNLLTRGPLLAGTLGANVGRLRLVLYFLASLLTAAAVTTVGSVGFVGLVVPHLVRLALGNDQRLLLPAATLAGGALLTLADTLARSIIAPQQLPVGVLTALIGVPVFLFLLARAPKVEQA